MLRAKSNMAGIVFWWTGLKLGMLLLHSCNSSTQEMAQQLRVCTALRGPKSVPDLISGSSRLPITPETGSNTSNLCRHLHECDAHKLTMIHTYIHTYMHTCIHTYIHTYMHTYIVAGEVAQWLRPHCSFREPSQVQFPASTWWLTNHL